MAVWTRAGCLVVWLAVAGCGRAALQLGRGATEGAVAAAETSEADRPDDELDFNYVGSQLSRGLVEGGVSQLAEPAQLAQLERLFERAMAGAGRGMARGLTSGAGVGPDTDADQEALVALSVQLGEGLARAFSGELVRQLGPDGNGPLAQSLSHAAARTSEGLVRGVGNELARGVPGCEGLTQRECVEQGILRLSRASSTGISEGAWRGASWVPLLLAFSLGAVGMLLLAWVVRLWRSAAGSLRRERTA